MPVSDIIEKTRTPPAEGGQSRPATGIHAQSRQVTAGSSRPTRRAPASAAPSLRSAVHDPEVQYRQLQALTEMDRDAVGFVSSMVGLVLGVSRAL